MGKHAYLIIAHNNFEMLRKLVQALDDKRNDLYVHIDAKAVLFDKSLLDGLVTQANLILVERIPVYWGGYSQIAVELLLLEAATKTPHDYYHLISGIDIPLKSQNEIHRFFQEHSGTEFVGIDSVAMQTQNFTHRYKYYYLFPNAEVRSPKAKDRLPICCRKIFLALQKRLGIDRTKKSSMVFYKGQNWFSITHGLACYLVQQKEAIEKVFSHSFCCDEVFLQTFAMQSPYKDNIYGKAMRCVDWKRGSPYTFRAEDYDILIRSDYFFARKFDYQTDPVIVDRLYERLETLD